MKILILLCSLTVAALVVPIPNLHAQSYADVYGSYNYKGNLKVRDTTFLKRLIAGDYSLDSSALVQFNSTSKGILVPRLTTDQRAGILHPAEGLLVYDLTVSCFFYYSDTAWINMCSSSNTTGVHFTGKDTLNNVLTDWSSVDSLGNSYFIAVVKSNGRVGIGTSNPTADFQVGDSATPKKFRYVDGNQSTGKVLTSDISGNATWQIPTGGSGGTSWSYYGNTGTGTGTNYLGTADNNGLALKTAGVTFGYIDSAQMFNFYTSFDSNTYGINTTNNTDGYGLNGIFIGNETSHKGLSIVDATPFGLSKNLCLIGDFQNTHLLIDDSGTELKSLGNLKIKADQNLRLTSNLAAVDIEGQMLTQFNPTVLSDNIADSSSVTSNIISYGATYGNNTLSGGAIISDNYLTDAGSSCIGNILVGNGGNQGQTSEIITNEMHAASHMDSNYLEGAAIMWGLGKHSAYSNFSHNYLKNTNSLVQLYGISGESGENVVWDTVTGDNNSEIFNITMMSFDSLAYNTLAGSNTNINNLIMQNSILNYCHFVSPNTGFNFSQLFNSRIVNDTVNVVNCLFHNVNKDFSTETQPWSNIMLLNDYVGIGINSKPTAALQIGDNNNSQGFRFVDGNQAKGKILTSDGDGNAFWQYANISGSQFLDSTAYFTPGKTDSIGPGDSIVISDTVAVFPYRYNIIDSTGVLSDLTISLPSSPVEGEWIEIKLAQSHVLVHYLNGSVANSAPPYIEPQNLYIKLVFRASRNTWY